MSDFTFFALGSGDPIPDHWNSCFVLKNDAWNDFGHYLRFDLIHIDANGARTNFGKVKILHRVGASSESGSTVRRAFSVESRTSLPASFSDLDANYISLGQSDDYYTELGRQFGSAGALEILEALHDIAELPGLAGPFEPSPQFRNGLLRENSAKRARLAGARWVRGEPVLPVKPAFSYECRIANEPVPTSTFFDFARRDQLPSRIVAIVGRNAVGKTVFLSKLAGDLAQIDRVSEERLGERVDRFSKGQPLFARVIAVSYSAFDRFRRPKSEPHSSYIYCGIRDERGAISQSALEESYRTNKARILDHDRHNVWIRHILQILGEAEGLSRERLRAEIERDDVPSILEELSSGQAILCHFVTALLAWIESESIVLFDEPETHLHPNAVANLFLVLSEILANFDSYAVVATHSPIVLQEIPSKRVLHFVREGDQTIAEPLMFESFGESISELTRHVFKTFDVDSLYKSVLSELAQEYPPERVLELFPHGLGLAAQSFLLGRYGEKPKA